MTNETEKVITHKSHREHNVGRKAEKKKAKKAHVLELTDKQKNPKAFTFNSAIKAERRFRRKQDIETKKQHVPFVDRTPLEPPPILVAVVGPPKVGKSLIIQCLIKSYVRQPLTNIVGPVTVVSGKKRRITFMECNNDINSMIDMAKVADLVLLLVDASFGFEMEIFEFLNICQVHGMPRIMGVLTHLDLIKNAKQMKKTKKTLKHRFWTEVYSGAKLFYLSGLIHGEYLRTEIKNLARFISVMKFKPLTWHTTHAYILADRVEDLTPPELIRQNPKINRTISLYGYVRGIPLNKESSVHIPGCGDLKIKDISFLPDPCPLPEQLKKRALIEKERLIYAPFSGVGGIVYDKDAVYIELGGSHSHLEKKTSLVGALIETQETLDQKLQHSKLQLFSNADPIKSQDITDNFCHAAEIVIDSGRCRRKVVFDNAVSETHNLVVSNSSDDEESEEEESNENSSKEIDSDAIDTDGGTEKIESYSTNETNKSDKVNPVKTDEYQVMNKHRIQDKKRKNEDHKWESVEVKKKRISLSNSKSNNNGSIVEEEEKEKSNDIKVLNNTEIYHSTSKDSDIFIQNKISEALNQLNVRCYKTRERINRESECFDELNDDDSRTGSGEDDPDNPYVVTDEEAKVAEGIINNENDNINKSEESTDSDSSVEDEVKWKENLAGKAKTAFHNRRQSKNLMKVVYGTFDRNTMNKENKKTEEAEDENIEGDGFFRVVQEQQKQKIKERELQNQDECVFFPTTEQNWLNDENKTIVMNRFVTGKWKYTENAEELLKLDDLNEDEFYGDFEDLETGEKHEVKPPKEIVVDEMKEKKKLLEKKRKLKEQFDLEYDNGESKTYYDELKLEVEKQTNLNRSEFEGVDDNVRVQLEGYRPGMYVRVEIESVPCELITHLDPAYPLIIGGLLYGEENVGYVHTRIKKHRWYSKILKSRDPLIFSVGWRRFQTLPVFSKLEDNLRNRMLKYTPEHVACMAHFWGPVTPQSTGILAIQDVATSSSGFRIAATGSIVEMEKSTQIMKKLKLTGVPMKIYKKTAFIKDMFNSALEVAKFEGARIKTVSGIRGQIKKAISKPEGCFRATFEDKILLSDIVFCRTWYKVDVPKFYNPVTSLLLPLKEKSQWQGVKTTGQLKRENNLHAPANKDCMYTPVEREIKVFKPLTIPRSLQKALPYRDKPKIPSVGLRNGGRIAVVREPKEANIAKMMRMIKTNYAHKQKQLKEATKQRIESHQRKIEALEARKLKRQKEMKKHVFRELSKLDKKGKP